MNDKLIETAWKAHLKHVYFDSDPVDVAVLRIAFFSGARAAVFAMELGGAKAAESISREVRAFERSMIQRARRGETTQ